MRCPKIRLCVRVCANSKLISRSLLFCSPVPQVVVLPSGSVSARTQCVTSGGTDCEWRASHGDAYDDDCDGATLRLEIAEGVERTVSKLQVRFELWNENTLRDDLIGAAEVAVPVAATLTSRETNAAWRSTPVQSLAIDTGGTLQVAVTCTDGPH